MKRKRNRTFRARLWTCFVLFTAAVFAALWLLQTVFLQRFYDGMAIKNVKAAADEIAAQQDAADLEALLDELAYENSLLIFLTDRQGTLLYGTDEHSHVYQRERPRGAESDNPYDDPSKPRGWRLGAERNLSLPQDYAAFLERIAQSGDGTVGYRLESGAAYVYGRVLSAAGDGTVLYISTSLDAVGGTVAILRTQLLWVTAASVLLAFAMAFFLSRRFSRPVAAISCQAKRMAEGQFTGNFERGFCTELDELADSLDRTADALSRTERFRREFLANVSHDLRTPLTMIRGYAEMVRDISWEDAAQRETDLSVIIREADRLTVLVNDILEYTSLQSGARKMDLESMDLSAAAREALDRFGPLCRRSGWRIEARIQPELMVYGDEKQLSRVLYNLIDNALSHAGAEKRVQVTLRDAGACVRAEVRDFGEGIPAQDLPYVWERYFTQKQQKRSGQGCGLGLAISREILLAHRAAFGVESAPGQGSTFWFEVRKAPPEGENTALPVPETAQL